MAIGDSVQQMIGAATTNRQPSSGVEEQISAIVKEGETDLIAVYNGSIFRAILRAVIQTGDAVGDTANAPERKDSYNTSIMITNSVYIRKAGTSDVVYIGGVQTNA
jgi:hypothetical protein